MLLVDHRETQAPERHGLLYQRMRAHDEAGAAPGEPLAHRRLFRGRHPAEQQLRPDVEGLEQARERGLVLLGEQLGRRHDRRLVAVLRGEQHREERHDRLAGPHVAHQQTVHPQGRRHVFGDLADGVPLVAGELERQVLLETSRQLALQLEADSGAGAFGQMASASLHELLVEQLVERQPAAARLCLRDRARPVQ